MKLIIDIPDQEYEDIQAYNINMDGVDVVCESILHGIPLDGVLQEIRQEIDDMPLRPQYQRTEHEHRGYDMYECFNCGARAVIWDSDFDFQDFGYEGEGVVHICHCRNCGAEIEYRCPNNPEEGDEGSDR